MIFHPTPSFRATTVPFPAMSKEAAKEGTVVYMREERDLLRTLIKEYRKLVENKTTPPKRLKLKHGTNSALSITASLVFVQGTLNN